MVDLFELYSIVCLSGTPMFLINTRLPCKLTVKNVHKRNFGTVLSTFTSDSFPLLPADSLLHTSFSNSSCICRKTVCLVRLLYEFFMRSYFPLFSFVPTFCSCRYLLCVTLGHNAAVSSFSADSRRFSAVGPVGMLMPFGLLMQLGRNENPWR